MLKNPSFELPYIQDSGTVLVADEWRPFWSTGNAPPLGGDSGPCQKPEFKPLPKHIDGRRVVDGDIAQCWFIRWKIMDAGIYQAVDAVAGRDYSFDVSAQAWCSESNDPTVSDGELYISLGIDPRGGDNWQSPDIIWSDWEWVGPEHKRYESPRVKAESPKITVFVRAWNKWRLSHNDVYVDDARFYGSSTPPSGDIDYDFIRQIVAEELDKRKPARYP